jgi:hypothetical protein
MKTFAIVLMLLSSQLAFAALPSDWYLAGKDPTHFDAQKDPSGWNGKPALVLRSKTPAETGWATVMSTFRADQYRGKRVRFSAMMRTDGVQGWAGLWMRVDGQPTKHSLAFDNMQNRPIKGTTAWKRYEVVLDVEQDAEVIAFGFLTNAGGAAYFCVPTIDVVDNTVPTTASSIPIQPQLDLSK